MCKSDELDISLNMFLQLNYLFLAKKMCLNYIQIISKIKF